MPTQIKPYLLLPNAKEAIKLYKEIFNAELVSHTPFTKENSGGMLPDDHDFENSTMHSEIKIGDAHIYLADDNAGSQQASGRVDIMLEPENYEQMKSFYDKAVEKGADVKMELQKTFWDAYFTRFEDPMGVGWQMNLQLDED